MKTSRELESIQLELSTLRDHFNQVSKNSSELECQLQDCLEDKKNALSNKKVEVGVSWNPFSKIDPIERRELVTAE